MNELKKFLESDLYLKTVSEISERFKVNIIKAESEFLFQTNVDKIAKAQTTVKKMTEVLADESAAVTEFSLIKLRNLFGEPIKQEYQKGEEQDEWESEAEEVQGLSDTFLIGYLLEYTILKNKPDFLEEFLLLTRIPERKKYAKQLKRFYSETVQ